MPWVETSVGDFRARHEAHDAQSARELLGRLQGQRARLEQLFPRPAPEHVAVVLHASGLGLSLAHPYLPLMRALSAPAHRRYFAGWFGRGEIHVLNEEALWHRASEVAGSRELLALTPIALYCHLVLAENNPDLPPPFTPGSFVRFARWAWLALGAAQYFSGQTEYVRPAIARRLREGPRPQFPPRLRDAALLGGSVFDLLVREEGRDAAVWLACRRLDPRGADAILRRAFGGRSVRQTADAWRSHLARLAAA